MNQITSKYSCGSTHEYNHISLDSCRNMSFTPEYENKISGVAHFSCYATIANDSHCFNSSYILHLTSKVSKHNTHIAQIPNITFIFFSLLSRSYRSLTKSAPNCQNGFHYINPRPFLVINICDLRETLRWCFTLNPAPLVRTGNCSARGRNKIEMGSLQDEIKAGSGLVFLRRHVMTYVSSL